LGFLCAEVIDGEDTMPRTGKHDDRTEQVPRGNRKTIKVEPLRPQVENLDKHYNDLAKFPSENPYPVLRIHKDGTVLYANKASERLLKTRSSGVGQPAPAQWRQLVKEVLVSGCVAGAEVKDDGHVFMLRAVPVIESNYVNFYGIDITELKTLEKALEKERQELRLIIDSSPIIVFYKDKEGKFARVNKAFAEALDIPEEKFLGKTVFDFYSANIAQKMTDDDRQIFKTGRPKLNIVEQYESARGIRWVKTDKIPIFDKDGIVVGLVGFAQDITEGKKAEETLSTSEIRFRELFNNMSSGVAVYEAVDDGADFVFKDFNTAGQRMEKTRREDVIGKRVTEVFPGVREMGLLEVFSRVWKNGRPKHHPTALYKDNRISSWRENYVYKLPSGEIVAIYNDVTEHKQAEEDLRRNEELYRVTFENTGTATVLIEEDTTIILANTEFERLSGFSKQEIEGKKKWTEFVAKEDLPWMLEQHHLRRKDKEDATKQYEFRFVTRSGNIRNITHLTDVILGTKRSVASLMDITERKLAEQKIQEYQKRLKQLALRLTLAEEKERRWIASQLHDEVSQTLAMAKIKLDTLRNSPPSEASAAMIEEISSSVEKVIQETRTLTFELSNPILYELGFEAAVAEWLNENIQEKHGIATEFHDDELLKPLEDDLKVMLFRNVRELLTNCIKHAKAGKIMVGLRRIADSIEVIVEDNGVGFDTAQLRTTASKKGKFGLFSVRENMENTGGSFKIESTPGAGCKAIMTAPLKDQSDKKEV
jgi:PAS domain S-box-containing protein